jgi:hypothetical protein
MSSSSNSDCIAADETEKVSRKSKKGWNGVKTHLRALSQNRGVVARTGGGGGGRTSGTQGGEARFEGEHLEEGRGGKRV